MDLKIISVVKFPYVYYVTIICLLSALGCCIKADTAVLVGALLILVDRVKCIPIYLVSFVVEDGFLDNEYSSSETVLSPLRRVSNKLPKVLMCSRVIESSDCSGCVEQRLFMCSSTYGSTKVEFIELCSVL